MELIHTQARDNGGEIAFERANGVFGRRLVAQVGFLHDILGIHRAPEHAVGDGKQVGTIGFKGFHSAFSYESTMRTDAVRFVVGSMLVFAVTESIEPAWELFQRFLSGSSILAR